MTTLPPTRRTLGIALACAALCAWLIAPDALAAGTKAPPGNSGVQEYVESIPDGTGRHVTNGLNNAALADAGGNLGPGTRAALEGAGRDGADAAALAAAGTTKPDKGTGGSGDGGKSPFAATLTTLGAAAGLGGLGAVLPVLLVLMLGAAVLYELKRRRAQS